MAMRKWYNKLCITLLKVLGFSAPMAFMACYGPAPLKGDEAEVAEQWNMASDSTRADTMTVDTDTITIIK